jgi:hypothetical protein
VPVFIGLLPLLSQSYLCNLWRTILAAWLVHGYTRVVIAVDAIAMPVTSFLVTLLNPPSPVVLSASDWEDLLANLRAEHLTPFVYARLRSTPAWRELPEPIRQALAEDFQTHSVRTYLMQAELAAIVETLRAVDVPVMLLKGAALGRIVYGSPAERPVSDFDLLIPSDRLELARDALIRQRQYHPTGLYWLTRWQQRYRAELQLVCDAPGRERLLVELHWSLVELPYYIDRIPMAEIWQEAAPAAGLPGAHVPDTATALLHSCAHWALHHSIEQHLLWLLDIDLLLRSSQLRWDAVLDRATRWGVQLALRTFVLRAEAQLGSPVPPAVRHQLAEWQPPEVESAMWGLGDERPGRAQQRVRTSWAALRGRQRMHYAGWLVLRALLWQPEQLARSRRRQSAAN